MDRTPVVLFRPDYNLQSELDICRKYFPTIERRTLAPYYSLVIGRYSVLPFYQELCDDLKENDSQLINSPPQHYWIANFHWYHDLKDFTPRTWTDHDIHSAPENIPFVVKGRTNSRKHNWNTLMFAKDRRSASQIADQLAGDSLIGYQGIIYREYIPLVTYEIGINDLPFTNEYRFFLLGKKILASGFYWTSMEGAENRPPAPKEAIELVNQVAEIASQYKNFYVLDVAEKQSGGWTLVEINDGQCSGLSLVDPEELYLNLSMEIKKIG